MIESLPRVQSAADTESDISEDEEAREANVRSRCSLLSIASGFVDQLALQTCGERSNVRHLHSSATFRIFSHEMPTV